MSEAGVGLSDLPDGWTWTTLGEIIEPSKKKVNPLEIEEVPYISLEHIEKDTGKLLRHGRSSDVRSSKTKFNSGDLLYGKLRPYLNKVYISDFEGVCSTDLLVFPKNELLSSMFLLYRFLCRDFVNYASHNVSGVNLPRVNFQTLSRFKIPLPPLPEQHRIVAKIEELFTKLDAGINELYKAQSQLKRYRQSVLKSAFEGKLTETWRAEHQGEIEPVSVLLERILKERREKWEAEQLEQMKAKGKMPKDDKWKMKYKEPIALDTSNLPKLPDGWRWTTVGSISLIASGQTPKGINDLDSAGEIPFYKISDMNKLGSEKFMRTAEITLDNDEIERLRIHVREQGTVVFPKRGGAIATNKKRILSCPSAYDLNIMGVLPYIVPTDFFYQWLLSIDLAALSDGSNVPQLNHKDINPLPFPLPPLSEQQAIISEVESRLSIAEAVEKTITVELKRAEQLRQSILKKAFSGKLVPQDPSDEPASILLERIRAEKSQHSQGQRQLKLV